MKKIKAIALSLFLSTSLGWTADGDDFFPGFKKGFLKREGAAAAAAKSPDISTATRELDLVIGDLGRYSVDETLKSTLVTKTRELFSNIFSGKLDAVYSSREYYYTWLKARSLRNTDLRSEGVDLWGNGIAMQLVKAYEVLDHIFISGLLDYLDGLPDGADKLRKEFFLLYRGSNRSCGKLIALKPEWAEYFPKYPIEDVPIIGYYQDTTLPDRPYKLYLMNNGKEYSGAKTVPSPSLSTYQWGEFSMMTPTKSLSGDRIVLDQTNDGFILDKQGKLVAQNGTAVFASTEWAPGRSTAYRYEFDDDLGRMVFRSVDDSYLGEIIDVAGGIDQLLTEQLIFIPDSEYTLAEGWRIDREDSRELLPFLYALKANTRDKGLSILLEELITLMRKSLEDRAMTDDALYLKRTAGDILKAPFPVVPRHIEDKSTLVAASAAAGAENKTTTLVVPVGTVSATASVSASESTGATGGTGALKEKEMPEVVPTSPTEVEVAQKETRLTAAKAAMEPPVKPAKKKNIGGPLKEPAEAPSSAAATTIDAVEAAALGKLEQLRHLKPSEVSAILSEMASQLSSVGIDASSEKVRGRGSHFAKGLKSTVTGAKAAVSLVRRPVKQGFQVGTLRKIVKDFAARARLISISKAKAAGGAGGRP